MTIPKPTNKITIKTQKIWGEFMSFTHAYNTYSCTSNIPQDAGFYKENPVWNTLYVAITSFMLYTFLKH